MGRPVFEVLTRQPAAQLRTEFDRVFRAGEIQQMDIQVEARERTARTGSAGFPCGSTARRSLT